MLLQTRKTGVVELFLSLRRQNLHFDGNETDLRSLDKTFPDNAIRSQQNKNFREWKVDATRAISFRTCALTTWQECVLQTPSAASSLLCNGKIVKVNVPSLQNEIWTHSHPSVLLKHQRSRSQSGAVRRRQYKICDAQLKNNKKYA